MFENMAWCFSVSKTWNKEIKYSKTLHQVSFFGFFLQLKKFEIQKYNFTFSTLPSDQAILKKMKFWF